MALQLSCETQLEALVFNLSWHEANPGLLGLASMLSLHHAYVHKQDW